MHELALMDSVVSTIGEKLANRTITRIRLQIGQWTAVSQDALRFCFEVCSRGTAMEGATLEVEQVPARARCALCGAVSPMTELTMRCACGSSDLQLQSGDELRITEVEVL